MRYHIEYSTINYAWSEKTDSFAEVKRIANEFRYERHVRLTIWDAKKKDFIFWKRALCYRPDTDFAE